jgi:hypothetical protein
MYTVEMNEVPAETERCYDSLSFLHVAMIESEIIPKKKIPSPFGKGIPFLPEPIQLFML